MLTCGVDEVGRGALVGPVVSVAALFSCKENPLPKHIKDSKKFNSDSRREKAFKEILSCPYLVDFGIGQISAEEIDKIGIQSATLRSMFEAVKDLKIEPHRIIVDGQFYIPGIKKDKQKVVPKADRDYWQVSAASVLAKVIRDRYVGELFERMGLPELTSSKGYITPELKANIDNIDVGTVRSSYKL